MRIILFNLHSDIILKKALEKTDVGIKINGLHINNLRYAEETVYAESMEELQQFLNNVRDVSKEMVLNIDASKTKFMVCSREPHGNAHLDVNEKRIQSENSNT